MKSLKTLIERKEAAVEIEIDGGVTDKHAETLIASGADVLVAGSHVFKAEDPEDIIRTLKQL